jgi:hypothetical protein
VLAFAAGEIADFVHDGANGWLLPGDAADASFATRLVELLQRPDLLAAARTRAVLPALPDWDGVTDAFVRACAGS